MSSATAVSPTAESWCSPIGPKAAVVGSAPGAAMVCSSSDSGSLAKAVPSTDTVTWPPRPSSTAGSSLSTSSTMPLAMSVTQTSPDAGSCTASVVPPSATSAPIGISVRLSSVV